MSKVIPQERNSRVARHALYAAECRSDSFWPKVSVRGADECWPWTAFVGSGGYGVFRAAKRNTRAHRAAYALTHGEVPAGMYVLHTCDNRLCVNPRHLWLGNSSDNMYDMHRKGRGNLPARPLFKRQDVCSRGHPLTGDNVRIRRGRIRCCRICRRASNKASRERCKARAA